MPKALKVDWELIQALYVQGETAKRLSERFQIKEISIYSRAKRLGWPKLREECRRNKLERASKAVQNQTVTKVRKIRDSLAKAEERVLQSIEAQPVESYVGDALEQVQRIIHSAAKTSVEILGIGAESEDSVNPSVMESIGDADIIEVEVVTTPEPAQIEGKSAVSK